MSEGNAQNVEKLKDGISGDHGYIYEKRVCMLFAVRAYIRDLKDFQLRYQVPEEDVGKFDDIVFSFVYKGQKVFQICQLKHKENEQTKISNSQLFIENDKGDYKLLKYILSWMDLVSNNTLNGEVKMAVVMTNIDFDLQSENKLRMNEVDWYDCKTKIQLNRLTLNKDAIFDSSKYKFRRQNSTECYYKKAKYYKFDDENIIPILKEQINRFIKKLIRLENEVIKPENPKYDSQQQKLKEAKEALKESLKNITENDIREALKFIIYAVNQPNDTELKQIIKEEIMEHFKLQNVDTVYNALENAFTEWCSKKVPLSSTDSSFLTQQHIIGFKDVKFFFEKFVKKKQILFGVTAPTSSFTGRLDELDFIREKLEEQHDLIISQLAITGLGGIGKTELTRQFIDKYGQSDFYGRVIWIEAENDDTVKNSFMRLAELIGIPDRDKISLLTIIDQVFEYFCGVKVLFVFDNFDKNTEGISGNNVDKNLVIYCRKRASGLLKEDRPYFIFTSRNRKCLKGDIEGVATLDLKVLTNEEAQNLIMLCVKNSIKGDAGNLAEKLQNFPLALKQATAYINEQNEIKNVTGGRYEIKDYLEEFHKKTKELLNFKYTNRFGEYEKTTFVTWNVTLDAIQKDKTNGKKVIEILKIMSYLYADKIDANMFLPLFDNDETRCGKAILLLDKYSLITKIENSKFYQIHRLVQAVIQLKFKEFEEEILVQAWNFINLELYKNFLIREKGKESDWYEAKKNCTVEEYLHYNNLSTYMENYEQLTEIFGLFFDNIHDSVLSTAVKKGDIEKIKELKLSKDILKEYTKGGFEDMIKSKNNEVIKYFIENGYLDFNDNMLSLCLKYHNHDLFVYFLKKFKSELPILSTELISDIKEGKSDSLLELIENKESEENVRKLRVSLFYASFYNQEPIVKLLIDNNIKPDFKIMKWNINYVPIFVAVRQEYSHIVKILLKPYDNVEFWKDVLQKIIFEFLKLVADINDIEYGGRNYTNLYYAQTLYFKLMIAYYLFNGTTYCLSKQRITKVIEIIKNDPVKNSIYENIVIKMRSNVPQCEFIKLLIKSSINWKIYSSNLNNYEGETELISCVRDLTLDFLNTDCQVETVKTIVEEGVDVNAIDQNGNNALYYAVDLHEPDIFNYLLPKTNSMHEEILMKAIKKDKLSCFESILEMHFSHDHIFPNQKSLLEVAKENNSIEIVDHLIVLSKVYENGEMGLINYIKDRFKYRCRGDLNKKGDIAKIKGLKLFKKALREYAEKNFEKLIRLQRNETIIYFIENGYLDFNDNMPLQCFKYSKPNLDLFKYFVENFDDLSKILLLSTEFICDIKEGKSDSLLRLIENKELEENVKKLRVSLFYASLYNQESIVKLLIDNNIKPDLKITQGNIINYLPIYVAVRQEYSHIVKILLKPIDKVEFWKDFLQSIFEFLELFAEVNGVEHGGRSFTNLYYAKNFKAKVKIAYRLLNRFKDPIHFNFDQMLSETIEIIKNDPVKNSLHEQILIKMRLNVPQCEFIRLLVEAEIYDQILDTLEIFKNLNKYEGETELISCVRDLTLDFIYYEVQLKTVENIVNKGVDVNVTDQNGNNALYYAVDLHEPDIFNYLLPKTNSMHEEILMKAIKKDKLSCFESLFEMYFSHDHIFPNQKSLLEVAYENRSSEIGTHLIYLTKVYENDEMGLINYIKDIFKYSNRGNLNYVQLLLNNGVNVNTMDSEQHDALFYSIEQKSYDLFWFLLSKGSLVSEDTLKRAIELDDIQAVKGIIPRYFKKNHYLNKNDCSIFDFANQCKAKKVQEFLLKKTQRLKL